MNLNDKEFLKAVGCSGTFFPISNHNYNNIYEGLGINIVQCKYCFSEFAFSKTNVNCKNCGAPVSDWTL